MADFVPPTDDFERALRTWAAADRIVVWAEVLAERHGLDRNLVEDLREATPEAETDEGESPFNLALARFLDALEEAG